MCSQLNRAKETLNNIIKFSHMKETESNLQVDYEERINEKNNGIFDGASWGAINNISKVR